MAPIYLVTLKRFLKEYHNHVSILEGKAVNWTNDINTGNLMFYINATSGSEIFCYIHKDRNNIPASIKSFMREDWMTLGTLDISNYSHRQQQEPVSNPLYEVKA